MGCADVPDEGAACEPHEVDAESVLKARAAMPDMTYVSSVFRALGDATRSSILYLLWQREWCVHDLAAILDTSVSNVSHHLRLLRVMRLVKARRIGRRVVYTLDDEHVEELLSAAFRHAEHG